MTGRRTGENRWVRAFHRAGSVTLRSVTRVLHILWLEVTGLLFLVLAVIGGGAAVREYHRGASGKMALAAAFALLFADFGVSSFWRSRRTASSFKFGSFQKPSHKLPSEGAASGAANDNKIQDFSP